MKKQLTVVAGIFLLCFLQFNLAYSQCVPQTASGMPGVTPPTENLACIEKGVPYNEVIYIENFNQFNTQSGTAQINYLRIDSITNLPCDIEWSANNANNTYQAAETGCINIFGTTNDNVGQYRVKIYITVEVNAPALGVIILQDEAEALVQLVEQLSGQPSGVNFKYYLRVIDLGTSCPLLDTTASATNLTACAPAPSPIDLDFTISNTTPCEGESFTVDAVVSGNGVAPYTYEWSPANLFDTPAAATSNVTIADAGTTTLTLKVFDSNGDSATVSKDVTVDVCVGIDNVEKLNNIRIYPNPSNGVFTVEGNFSASQIGVTVFNIAGKEVFADEFKNNNTNFSANINTTNLQKGIYLVKVSSENMVQYQRISIQ